VHFFRTSPKIFFLNPKVTVSGTNIFVAHLNKGTRQFTAYENIVNIGKEKITTSNAMILPFPLKQGESIELIDLSNYPTFFADCENCFKEQTKSNSRGISKSRSTDNYLEVQQVGGYKCSVAESLDDILKINPNVFVLPKDIHELLSNHYSKGFGFVVCLFSSDVLKTHPIAFTHSTIGENQLYVPTKHEHGNHPEKKKLVASVAYHQHFIKGTHMKLPNQGRVEVTDYADWDHVIYSVNSKAIEGGAPEATFGKKKVDEVIKKIPVSGFDSPKHFRRLKINGTVENVDVVLNCE
jgi:hypothetical protein